MLHGRWRRNPAHTREIRIKGVDYDLVGTFGKRELPAGTTYKLTADGSSFVAETAQTYAETAESTAKTEVAPFSVYVEAEPDRVFNIDIDPGITTGVNATENDEMHNGIRIERNGDMLVIYSDSTRKIEMFGVDGMLVRVISLVEGRNTVEGLFPWRIRDKRRESRNLTSFSNRKAINKGGMSKF